MIYINLNGVSILRSKPIYVEPKEVPWNSDPIGFQGVFFGFSRVLANYMYTR